MQEATRSRISLEAVHQAIQAVEERPLYAWATVAIWDGPEGDISVIGEADPLQLKGYLHSGLWVAAHEKDGSEGELESSHFDAADDVRSFPLGSMDVVRIGGNSIGRGSFHPGWRWSESIAPIIDQSLCPLEHTGFVVSGRMGFRMEDGAELNVSAGEAICIPPGHDAWTIGDETCVIVEIQSAAEYGLSPTVNS